MTDMEKLAAFLVELNTIDSNFNLSVDAKDNFYMAGGRQEIPTPEKKGQWKYFSSPHAECPLDAARACLVRLQRAEFVRTGFSKPYTTMCYAGSGKWIKVPR